MEREITEFRQTRERQLQEQVLVRDRTRGDDDQGREKDEADPQTAGTARGFVDRLLQRAVGDAESAQVGDG